MSRQILCEREEIRDFLELRAAHAARGEKSLCQGTLNLCGISYEIIYCLKPDPSEEVIEMKAKVHVFSDSVLCVGKICEFPESNADWERRISDRADGTRIRSTASLSKDGTLHQANQWSDHSICSCPEREKNWL